MSTIEDFENAPVGATATSPDGRQVYRREAETPVGADWALREGDARLWADAEGLALHRYTLGPAPAPAPTTAREALALAWELAHPVKEGQTIPKGTRYMQRLSPGGPTAEFLSSVDFKVSQNGELSVRTLEPLPNPEPDWLDAPAVLAAMDECSWQKVWFPKFGGYWECTCCGVERHWSKMADVTPLYPKGQDK